jgi:hypothetical protein
MRLLAGCLALVACACSDVPGTVEGGPCNAKGVCGKGLVCEEGTCVSSGQVSWEKMKTPTPAALNAVWGASENELFAVGASGTILRYRGEGLDWSDDSANKSASSTATLHSVWGRSASDVFAVGSSCVWGLKGGVWTKHKVPDPAKAGSELSSYTLYSVRGSPEAGVWASGDGASGQSELVVKFDDKDAWVVQSAGLSYAGSGLAVVGAQVFIVGNAQHVRMFDGASWVSKNLDGMTDLEAAWGTGPDNVWAVGPSGMLLRFDGAAWTTSPAARLKYRAKAIWGASAYDFYIVGEGTGHSDFRAIEHCTPACSPSPAPSELKSQLNGVWASADGKSVVVVGADGMVFRRSRP